MAQTKTQKGQQKFGKSKAPNNGVNPEGANPEGVNPNCMNPNGEDGEPFNSKTAAAAGRSCHADQNGMKNRHDTTHLSGMVAKVSRERPVPTSPDLQHLPNKTSSTVSSGPPNDQEYTRRKQKETHKGEQQPPLGLLAEVEIFVKTLQPWQQLLGIVLLVAVIFLGTWSSGQLWFAFRDVNNLKTLHQAAAPSGDVLPKKAAIPASWPGQEVANEKIRALSEEVERLQRDRDRLELGNEALDAQVKEAHQRVVQRNASFREITADLVLAKHNLDTCREETKGRAAENALCETKESNEVKRASEHKAQLGSCKEHTVRLEAELGTFDELNLKNREQEAELETLNEGVVALENRLRSCRGEIEQLSADLEECKNDILTEEVLHGKLKELQQTNRDLTSRHSELKKEVFWCEEDRSIYHVRMKDAEEELAKIREQPFNEKAGE